MSVKPPKGVDAVDRLLNHGERVRFVQDLDVPWREKFVLLTLVLSDRHPDERLSRGVAMTNATIAQRTSLPRRTVRDVLARLEACARIAIYPGVGRQPAIYFVNLDHDEDPHYGESFRRIYASKAFQLACGAKPGHIGRAVNQRRTEMAARLAAKQGNAPECIGSTFDMFNESPFDPMANASPFFPDEPRDSPFSDEPRDSPF